jgi:hypothetical protein
MDPSIVLRKAEKGINELRTREHRLPPGLRMVLILVDGKADIDGLRNKAASLSQIEEYLGTLLKDGFIEAGKEDDPTEITERTDVNVAATRAKWEIVEMASEVLGEEFARRATKRFMLVPDTPADLKDALNECCQFIALTIDESKARAVRDRGAKILSGIKE